MSLQNCIRRGIQTSIYVCVYVFIYLFVISVKHIQKCKHKIGRKHKNFIDIKVYGLLILFLTYWVNHDCKTYRSYDHHGCSGCYYDR